MNHIKSNNLNSKLLLIRFVIQLQTMVSNGMLDLGNIDDNANTMHHSEFEMIQCYSESFTLAMVIYETTICFL